VRSYWDKVHFYVQYVSVHSWHMRIGDGDHRKCWHFNDHWEYSTAIWHNLWPFGTVLVFRYKFPVLVCSDQERSGNPGNEWQQPAQLSVKHQNGIFSKTMKSRPAHSFPTRKLFVFDWDNWTKPYMCVTCTYTHSYYFKIFVHYDQFLSTNYVCT
jgi:hypothetical protein